MPTATTDILGALELETCFDDQLFRGGRDTRFGVGENPDSGFTLT